MNKIIIFLDKYFEKISIIYHCFFIFFLLYLIFIRDPDKKLPTIFIKILGLYVIMYGCIIFFLGEQIMN